MLRGAFSLARIARFGNDRFESRINEIFKHFNEGVMRKYVRQTRVFEYRSNTFPIITCLKLSELAIKAWLEPINARGERVSLVIGRATPA
jgi:hypothetical protein